MNRAVAKSKKLRVILSGSLLFGTMLGGLPEAWAAVQPDAGQVLRDGQHTDITTPVKPNTPNIIVDTTKPVDVNDQGAKVLVKGFQIVGPQSVFSEQELLQLLSDSVNKELSFTALEQLTERITKYHHDHGYPVAKAYLPAQNVKDGMVQIGVLIGTYDSIIVKTNGGVSETVIRGELGNIRSGQYITQRDLERAALLLNDLAAGGAKLTLAPGKKTGSSDLIIEVNTREGYDAALSLNNYGNRFTGRYQGTLSVNLPNMGGFGDALAVQGTLASGGGQNGGSFLWNAPLFGNGGKIAMSYSRTSYELGQDFAALGATGTADSAKLQFSYPLLRSRVKNLYIQTGYENKQLRDKISSAGTDVPKMAQVFNLGLNGDNSDQFMGGGFNRYSLNFSHGHLKIKDATSSATDGATARSAGSYDKWAFSAVRQQYINQRTTLLVSLTGQLASKNLDSSEKLSLGGADAVRAYPQGEASGDNGYIATGEVRWSIPVRQKDQYLQLAGFIDNGSVQINKYAWAPGSNRRTLSAIGLGFLWGKMDGCSVKVNYAWQLGSQAATSDTDRSGQLWVQTQWPL